jgi:UDP-N-acetylmuramyl pentapeptide phosphotransferase/UDP-N-acetylglucosamine-1-phosphate transferase
MFDLATLDLMHTTMYVGFTLVLFAAILLYFRFADRYQIIDKPNERSSHTEVTIRGGGMIYLVAAVIVMLLCPAYFLPCIALIVIGSISFLDDRITLSSRVRILFHVAAVAMIFYFLGIFSSIIWWAILGLFVVVIGIINAYNFMDGINGITGLYSLAVLIGLQYVNRLQIQFVEADLIWLPVLASIVFLFFNFRKKAICFAGDVGSITVSLWIAFLLLALILKTGDYKYILFLSVYGVDSVLTILHRIILRENIFKPHRLHFYQILANQQKMSHLVVASIYVLIQAAVISIIIFSSAGFMCLFFLSTTPLILIYIILKPSLMAKSPLNIMQTVPNE